MGSDRERWMVLEAQAGDREALDALIRSIQEPLYRYVASLVRNRSAAEDVLQESFLRICRKLVWLREPELFRPWAYRIASGEAFRRLRSEKARHERWNDAEELAEVAAAAAPDPFEPELAARIPDLLERLSPASRAVVVLFYLHEMSIAEVAAVLGLPIGTVKSRLSYGLTQLRRLVGPNSNSHKGGKDDRS